MNHTQPPAFDELAAADRALALRAHAALRASETLDYVESARLAATRAQVRSLMLESPAKRERWIWLAAPAALAGLVVAAVVLRFDIAAPGPQGGATESVAVDVNPAAPEALMWVSDEAGPDFYRDLAFYEWLQRRSPS